MTKYYFFTNGEEEVSIARDVFPMHEHLTKRLCNDDEAIFCDFDTANLLAVLNYYRIGMRNDANAILQYDIDRFQERLADKSVKKVKVVVGHKVFFTTRKTLEKLPYFATAFKFCNDNIDRDPSLFRQILSRLRHPMQHKGKTKELYEELLFWGVAAPQNTEKEEQEKREEFDGGEKCSNDIIALERYASTMQMEEENYTKQRVYPSLVYGYTFLTQSAPVISFFSQNIQDYTISRKKTIVLKPKKQKDSIEFTLESERGIELIGKTMLCIETKFHLQRIEDLFDNVTVTFTRKSDASQTVSFSVSSRLLATMSLMKKRQPMITHESNGSIFVSIPLQFFFDCLSMSMVTVYETVMQISVKCNKEMLSNKYLWSAVVDTFCVTIAEGMRFQEDDKLIEHHVCLLPTIIPQIKAEKGKKTVAKSVKLPKTMSLRSIYLVPYDIKSGNLVECSLNGFVKVRDTMFPLNPHANILAQDRHFEGKFETSQIDSRLWFVTLSLYSASSNQQSGHEFLYKGDTISFDFSVASDCEHIAFEVWTSVYEILRFNKEELKFFEFSDKRCDVDDWTKNAEEKRKREREEQTQRGGDDAVFRIVDPSEYRSAQTNERGFVSHQEEEEEGEEEEEEQLQQREETWSEGKEGNKEEEWQGGKEKEEKGEEKEKKGEEGEEEGEKEYNNDEKR